MQITNSREQEIQAIHSKYKDFYQIGGGLLLVCIGIWIGSILFTDRNGYFTNVYTEVMSITVTILVLDRLNDWRARIREKEALQKRLIREARGQSNEIAKAAIDWMRDEGWLEGKNSMIQDEFLCGANLCGANLRGANLQKSDLERANLEDANLREANIRQVNLWEANLQKADLREAKLQQSNLKKANLRKANLRKANLQEANLGNANLQQSNLWDANLQETDLRGTNLQEADLGFANLQQSNLWDANLRSVNLGNTKFDEKMVLPDSLMINDDYNAPQYDKYWTAETDMSRYTNSNHPDFWESAWVKQQQEDATE